METPKRIEKEWNWKKIATWLGIVALVVIIALGVGWISTACRAAGSEEEPTATTVPQQAQTTSTEIAMRNMTTKEAQEAIGAPVVRLGTEHETWTLSGLEQPVPASCPPGFLCTLATGDGIFVFVGEDGLTEKVYGGTFRLISSFPEGDAVQKGACALLKKEQEFASREVPPFTVNPGNFVCQ